MIRLYYTLLESVRAEQSKPEVRMLRILSAMTIFVLTSCASSPKINGVVIEPDQVLSTSGDAPMPQWAKEGELQPVRFEGGKVYSVGITQIKGDERPEAALRVSNNNAVSNIAQHIESRSEFVLQNSEQDYSTDTTSAKWIGSQVSSITAHNFSNEGVWWKRVVMSNEDGSRKIIYKCYSLVTLSEASLKEAVYAAIHKGESQHMLSENFQKQVDAQWNRFVENKPQSSDIRNPATSSAK